MLFGGGADAMRRQALVPLHHHFHTRRTAEARLLDVASGTGRFLTFVKDNYPRLDVTALDLSPNYLAQARRLLSPWSRAHVVQAAAESIPAPDASFDAVTCIFLFHELPRKIRAAAAAEMARVLKQDGILVFVETVQKGDRPEFDGLLELFPHRLSRALLRRLCAAGSGRNCLPGPDWKSSKPPWHLCRR